MIEKELFLAFHLLKGMGFKAKKEVLLKFNYDIEKTIAFLSQKNEIHLPLDSAKKIIDLCSKKSIQIITVKDEFYPERLREIQDPPVCLFVKGNVEVLKENFLAFVGTRRATPYGINATEKLISDLSQYRVGIASGFANGIDTVAHNSALKYEMPTVAVFACGVDVIYPHNNLKLYREMLNKGCIISEFIPGTKPQPFRFPIRFILSISISPSPLLWAILRKPISSGSNPMRYAPTASTSTALSPASITPCLTGLVLLSEFSPPTIPSTIMR